jgi:hypothetical protein
MSVWDSVRAEGTVVWDRDHSENYETDMQCLVVRKDGTAVYLDAQGCSCWEGEASETEFPDLATALSDVGVPMDVRDADFIKMKGRLS